MGRSIAMKLADELGIEFYDRDIVEAAAKRMGQRVSTISEEEEKAKSFYIRKKDRFRMGIYSISDEIFCTESEIIRDLAKKESCIIVGRCGDSILKDHPHHISVFIYAPYEKRLENCVKNLMMDEKEAISKLKEVDAARFNYHKKYCPEIKTMFDNKDIMIDSSRFGIEGTAQYLADLIRKEFY